MREPKHPVLRYFGGKWRLAPRIIKALPPHKHYTEAFGGAASVLIRKPRVPSEVYNDLSGDTVNLFRVLRDARKSEKLCAQLELTPFSREEFFSSGPNPNDDDVEKARKFVTISHLCYGSHVCSTPEGEGFRSSSKSVFPAVTFARLPQSVRAIAERFRGVLIENIPAVELLKKHDTPSSVHYVDPPYLHSTRSSSNEYKYEMDESEHDELCDVLLHLKGAVVVSGYASPKYERIFQSWNRIEFPALIEKSRPRTEVLWISRTTPDPIAEIL